MRVGALRPPRLAPGEVHVWHAALPGPGVDRAGLSARERLRAARMAGQTEAALYRLAHGGLRQLLGAYLDRPPVALRFRSGPHGKPALLRGRGEPDLQFSLSHSGTRVVIALSRGVPLGVDIERHRPARRMRALARRFFAPEEIALLDACEDAAFARMFYRLWVLKEATIKLTGRGLSQRLDGFAFDPRGPEPRLLRAPPGLSVSGLSPHLSEAIAGYGCAVIAGRAPMRFRHFQLGASSSGLPVRRLPSRRSCVPAQATHPGHVPRPETPLRGAHPRRASAEPA